MADDNNYERNRSIDVTKPKNQPQQQSSHIDASRVSAYTLREQASLEKLKKQVGNLNQKENRASRIKTIIAVVLVLILIALAIVFVVVIGKNTTTEEEIYDVRVSMQIENKAALTVITDTGQEVLRKINPGDRVPLSAYIRNSKNPQGEVLGEGDAPKPIYVRFKMVLILDYVERYDVMVPTMSDKWYKYNSEDEDKLIGNGGVFHDDHYYYYVGVLGVMQPEQLFTEILFDGNVLTCEDGGKYGQIQVHVESIPADIESITSRSIWTTAPETWINKMRNLGANNTQTPSETE